MEQGVSRAVRGRRLVIIESPYAGEVEENRAYARACLLDSLRRGEAPFASHLLYTQPGVLDDLAPEERALGIQAGLAWGRVADATVVYTDRGISPGMKLGIERATAEGRPIESRQIGKRHEALLDETAQLRVELDAIKKRALDAEASLCAKDIAIAELDEQCVDLAVAIFDGFDGDLARAPVTISNVWPLAKAIARREFLRAEKASAPR